MTDLPPWVHSQLQVPLGTNLSLIPRRGGEARRFLWQCPAGHEFFDLVGNRLRAHEKKCSTIDTQLRMRSLPGMRPSSDNNSSTAHPVLAVRLKRMALRNGYTAEEVPAQGGRRKH